MLKRKPQKLKHLKTIKNHKTFKKHFKEKNKNKNISKKKLVYFKFQNLPLLVYYLEKVI